MTLYGIDVSNHQKNFDFAAAKREGFSFATHKVTEGTGYRDPYWPRAKEQMAEHFPGRNAGYVFCKVDADPQREADAYFAHGGTSLVQIDYEDMDRAGSAQDLAKRVQAFLDRGARLLPVYIPRWYWSSRMKSFDLSWLPAPLWNSHYVGGSDYASKLYPGDDWRGPDGRQGWLPFGNKDVAFLQFSEQGRVAGQSIDVNAFRGDDSQLAALFGAATPESEFDVSDASAVAGQFFGPEGKGFDILGHAVETDPARNRFLTEAIAVILTQLTGGPNFEGWEQLGDGKDSAVPRRTIVDGMAHIKRQNDEILALLKGGK
ncbi:glycoside hydrolase family 25 protein [Rhodococcus sp. IEGM 1330]|uniref:glycoside hydrolase family 25 protein n=1 Tax=Rhodococcus sp. IEGM 1330 TaxID=3082225 RepID=UPI0029531739|nr:glycoside hydrolase family 25 protein [Rhodococcus sp. IEGM 1330]MDV8022254.1 glycoside hydrolase family 25 protein [Rhodococcus sp. IEGM 1330]